MCPLVSLGLYCEHFYILKYFPQKRKTFLGSWGKRIFPTEGAVCINARRREAGGVLEELRTVHCAEFRGGGREAEAMAKH